MNTETTVPAVADRKVVAHLSSATNLLFHIAARSHTLAEIFGVEPISTLDRSAAEPPLVFRSVPRPWLDPHPRDAAELTFNPQKFAKKLTACSDGQRYMMLWILNVWNPGFARTRWKFDLFQALGTLDGDNVAAICWWLERPIWP